MQAIILAGGLGTRLQAVLKHTPKPMAPIKEQPFLAYLLQFLKSQGFTSVILSVHFLREHIQTYFQTEFAGMTIDYAIEDTPLGTGGAIAFAIKKFSITQPVFILNGDTFVKLNYRAMLLAQQQSLAQFSMALRPVADCYRYGKVLVEKEQVIAFKEKGEGGEGLINAGVYLMQPDLLTHFSLAPAFSLENDFLFPHLSSIKPQAFLTDDYFIDIGIPEDYHRAQRELPQLMNQ